MLSRCRPEKDQPKSRMESLPSEIMLDILSRLPVSSLVQCKFVCRGWHTMSQDPRVVDLHFSRAAKNNPCLMFHSDYPISNQLFFENFSALNNGKSRVRNINSPFGSTMPQLDMVGSCNGLMCLLSENNTIYVHNPFTRNCQELPKSIEYSKQEVVLGFGFHPTTKEYKVVKILYHRKERNRDYPRSLRGGPRLQSDVQILTLGNPNWRSIGEVSYHLQNWPSQIFVNGRLHWVAWTRTFYPRRALASFDLVDEQFREVSGPDCGALRCNYHLVVLDDCLSAAVYGHYLQLDIWVMKEYGVKESWIKQFVIAPYSPISLKQDVDQSFRNSKIAREHKFIRIVCQMKNGEILLEYKSRELVSFDPKSETFKDLNLKFDGMPNFFQTVVHLGSLNWV